MRGWGKGQMTEFCYLKIILSFTVPNTGGVAKPYQVILDENSELNEKAIQLQDENEILQKVNRELITKTAQLQKENWRLGARAPQIQKDHVNQVITLVNCQATHSFLMFLTVALLFICLFIEYFNCILEYRFIASNVSTLAMDSSICGAIAGLLKSGSVRHLLSYCC